MIFFLVCGAAALLVAAWLILPLLRHRSGPTEAPEVALYRAQLDELDRDVARGTLDADEAARARTEIARRLLAADRAQGKPQGEAPAGLTRAAALVSVALVLAVTGALYWRLGAVDASGPYPDLPRAARIAAGDEMRAARPDQQTLEAAVAGMAAALVDPPADYVEMVDRLREIVPTRPDELQGWELLARHEAALGNYAAARAAQQQVIRLKGEDVPMADRVRLLDLMVAATQGMVSPEAEALAGRLLTTDPDNRAARYYVGLLYAQTDRPDIAFRLWRALVEDGPAENTHVALARGQVEEAAFRAGEDYQLPPAEPQRGPSAEDMAAAAEMDPEARAAMIEGMVASLESRLATGGGTAEEWARLILAKSVLGETAQAQAILTEAREVFVSRAEDLARIEQAATDAGLE